VSRRALDPKAVNDIVKQRVSAAGLEVGECAGVAVGISDGNGKPWRPAPRGNGAVSASIGAAGIKRLQQRYPTDWARRAIVLVIFCFLNIAIRGAFEVE
jgi:F420-0:gamma-glutamyl ligase